MILKNPLPLLWGTALLLLAVPKPVMAQEQKPEDPLMKIYRAAAPKINDLVHTKLAVSFDYKKRYMYGKEWVTINRKTKNTNFQN